MPTWRGSAPSGTAKMAETPEAYGMPAKSKGVPAAPARHLSAV